MPKTTQPLSVKEQARRQAASERMKAMHAAKQQLTGKNNEPAQPTENSAPQETVAAQGASTTPEATVTLGQDQFQALMARLEKVENGDHVTKTESTAQASSMGFDQFGKPQGVIQRYIVDPSYYKSPLDALYDLAELRRFNLRDNYELTWNVDQLQYETKYGTSMLDPKFTIELKRMVYDDDGALTQKRILIQTGVFFEDPATSIKEAVALGLPIDNANSREFLEQMRFLRYKQWLMDLFNPQLQKSTKPKITEQVIDGKVYRIEDYSTVVD